MIELSRPISIAGDVSVWLRLLTCATIIEKRLRRRFVELFDSTLPRFDLLAALERHPDGVSMGDLSRSLLVSNANVTEVVRQLTALGLVSVRLPPEDRRVSLVSLTESGRALFAELAAAHHSWIKAMFAAMPRDKLQQLFQLLGELISSLEAEKRE